MKKRNGFVSNSSSSSFCILGTEISILDITKEDWDKKRIFCDTDMYCSEEGKDGAFVDVADVARLSPYAEHFTFYRVAAWAGEGSKTKITIADLTEEKYVMLSDEYSMHFDIDWIIKMIEEEVI